MQTPPAASIVIADAHPLMRAGLAALIQSQPRLALLGEAASGGQALELCERLRPDLLLIDPHMPGGDGAAILARLRASRPALKVIILSGHAGEDEIERAMRAGASAYMLNSAPLGALMLCIQSVLAGKKYLMPELAARLAGRMHGGHGKHLTPRERDILGHLSTGMSNKVIARAAGIGVGTVKFHVKSIMAKLNAGTRTEAAMVAARRGLIQLN